MRIINFLGTCINPSISEIAEMRGKKFSESKAKKMIRDFCPDMYNSLALDFFNPWGSLTNIKKGKYLHLNHSQIDYIFEIEN